MVATRPAAKNVIQRVRFYLDADLSPRIAAIGRDLGLDAVSAHDVGMTEADDADQLGRAASEGRILVTRNRDDFIQLTLEAYHEHRPHAGLLLIAATGRHHQTSRVAHALRQWAGGRPIVVPYSVHWLTVR